MSSASNNLSNANAIEAHAANWLQRRQFWDWTQEDQADLDRWLAESAVHLVTYLRLEAAWSRSERLSALRVAQREGGVSFTGRIKRARSGIAVFLVFAALSVAAAQYILRAQDRVYTTPVGGHRTIVLANDSVAELNTDTVLRVQENEAVLERGEAFFRIKHNAAHPFKVLAGNHSIADLGTKFLVRNENGRLEVSLIEGRALVESVKNARQKALLAPGDVAVASSNRISVVKLPVAALAGKLSWQQGLLIFRHITLAGAAAEFNRYNTTKIIVADSEVARMKIYGTFQARNAATFANAAQALLGLHLTKTETEIIISR